jgi:hypothetical protein
MRILREIPWWSAWLLCGPALALYAGACLGLFFAGCNAVGRLAK